MPTATTAWEKTKTGSKKGFDKAWKGLDKLGAPVNRWSNKVGAEAFWPTTLDKESDKAARILQSFCKDGFYQEAENPADGPQGKQRVIKKIPSQVIKNAKGLAIFTTMRTGLWVSGAGGSGILVARMPNGEWSPPSGIMLHTAGLGFMIGVDIYDCVIVINNEKALEAFTKIRCTLGGEISAVAGPVGVGAIVETEIHKRQAPLFTYLKSRGFYAGVQVDGTVVIERTDENERFYGERIPVANIIAGKVRHPPRELKTLMETIRAAQGDTDVDEGLVASGQTPGDVDLEEDPGPLFGIPDADDPDPFGVRALESAGLEIREAGTRSRPSSEQFEYRPSPTSPVFNIFTHRRMGSKDSISRSSFDSRRRMSVDRATQTEDRGVQTDDLSPPPSPRKSLPQIRDEPERETGATGLNIVIPGHQQHGTINAERTDVSRTEKHGFANEVETGDAAGLHQPPPAYAERSHSKSSPAPIPAKDENESNYDSPDDYEADDDEEPFEHDKVNYGELNEPNGHLEGVQAVNFGGGPAQMISKPKIVTIGKRVPPKLPPRNPRRPPLDSPSHSNGSTQTDTATKTHSNGFVQTNPMTEKLEDSDLPTPTKAIEPHTNDNFPSHEHGSERGKGEKELHSDVPNDDFYSVPTTPVVGPGTTV
ncbi:MAG: hypothetical protein M1824_000910 [Vezdaea acicularis]|nr:MAG: hypothetical protein M1824_000910 [Vezdaea acicularis]